LVGIVLRSMSEIFASRYSLSLQRRKRSEEVFGWLKTMDAVRKTTLQGRYGQGVVSHRRVTSDALPNLPIIAPLLFTGRAMPVSGRREAPKADFPIKKRWDKRENYEFLTTLLGLPICYEDFERERLLVWYLSNTN
jgi:hypothetical protein